MKRYFSLVEVLVVLVIIAILISLALPAISHMRSMAHKAQCANQYRQIHTLIQLYAEDNEDYLPRWNITDYYYHATEGKPKYKREAGNTKGWHGHLAPYLLQKKNNNWSERQGSEWVNLVNSSYHENSAGDRRLTYKSGYTRKYDSHVPGYGPLKVFLCPKAIQENTVGRLYKTFGIPFTYMGNTEFFGGAMVTYALNERARTTHTSARISDIEDPSGKCMLYEAAPHHEGRNPTSDPSKKGFSSASAVSELTNIFGVTNDPIEFHYFSGDPVNNNSGGSDGEQKGHHFSMIFHHDTDEDTLEGYQQILMADGSVHRAHEWWLYLHAGYLQARKGKGIQPGKILSYEKNLWIE